MRDSCKKLYQLLTLGLMYIVISLTKLEFKFITYALLPRIFYLNFLAGILHYQRSVQGGVVSQLEHSLFKKIGNLKFFPLLWAVNLLVGQMLMISTFEGKNFYLGNTISDWECILCLFSSTYLNYSAHSLLRFDIQDRTTSFVKDFIQVIYFPSCISSQIGYISLNRSNKEQSIINTLILRLPFNLILSKFSEVLIIPLSGHIVRLLSFIIYLIEIKNITQSIHNQQAMSPSTNNAKYNDVKNETESYVDYKTHMTILLTLFCVVICIIGISAIQIMKVFLRRNETSIPEPVDQMQNIIDDNHSIELSEESGLNDLEIASLSKIQFSLEESNLMCSICFADLQYNQFFYPLQCQHLFHTNCLDIWLKSKNTCPNCRSPVLHRIQTLLAYASSNSDRQSNHNHNYSDSDSQPNFEQDDNFNLPTQ